MKNTNRPMTRFRSISLDRPTLIAALLCLALAVVTRLIPHPPNWTAVGALALWSTRLFRGRWTPIAIPLAVLFVTDLILGFHSTMLGVYGGFALVSILGFWAHSSWARLAAGSLMASLVFFTISNLSVWISEGLYPMTVEGLLQCFTLAIPFLNHQIAGDLTFCGLFALTLHAAYRLEGRSPAKLA